MSPTLILDSKHIRLCACEQNLLHHEVSAHIKSDVVDKIEHQYGRCTYLCQREGERDDDDDDGT